MEDKRKDKSGWKKYCSVIGCGERSKDMFRFPQNSALRLQWKTVCKVQRSVSDEMRVCLRHFRSSDVLLCADGRRRVKKDAVPSLHLPDGRVVRKSKRNCIVPGCLLGPQEGVTLHHFPKCPDRREKWLTPLLLHGETVNENSFICCRHFKETDFSVSSNGRKILRQIAFPSLHLPSEKECCRNLSSSSSSLLWKILCDCSSSSVKDDKNDPQCSDDNEVSSDDSLVDFETLPLTVVLSETQQAASRSVTPSEMSEVHQTLQKFAASLTLNAGESGKSDIKDVFQQLAISDTTGAQTQTNVQKFTLIDLLKTDVQCKSFLGVTLKLFNGLAKLCQQLKPDSHNSVMTMKERVAMVLCKLYLNLSLECLGVLFGVGRLVCSINFSPTVHLLARILECSIYWPSKEDNLKNMPKCFEKFKNTRVVLDCTEIPVDSPNCLKCRIRMYSHYKERLTVKFMVGVAPSGLLIARSKCYGGKASDQKIFAESDLIKKDLLEPFCDAVMVDKGFKVDTVCIERNIKIHRPPFVIKKQPQSEENAIFNAPVAHAKVHVEKAIQRMKLFQVLSGKLSWFVVPDIDDIITVVMALVNLSPPIFSKERFLTNADCGC